MVPARILWSPRALSRLAELGEQLQVLTVRHGRERPVEAEELRGPLLR